MHAYVPPFLGCRAESFPLSLHFGVLFPSACTSVINRCEVHACLILHLLWPALAATSLYIQLGGHDCVQLRQKYDQRFF